MQNNPVQPFYWYFLKELRSPWVILNSCLIGAAINFFSTEHLFSSPVAFVIPFLVQSLSRSSMAFKNRHQSLLGLLPLERTDPAFIMDLAGNILLSGGQTKAFFEHQGFSNISEFIGPLAVQQIVDHFNSGLDTKKTAHEYYANSTCKWYSVRVKQVKNPRGSQSVLVWMDDVSAVKQLHERIFAISNYSDQVIRHLDDLTQRQDIFTHLAPLILGMGFQGAFITLQEPDGGWFGMSAKTEGPDLVFSDYIRLEKDTDAPVMLSRQESGLVEKFACDFESQEAFETEFKFYPRIKHFLGAPVTHFVNFHEGDCSVIAFNKKGVSRSEDALFVHSMVNTTRSLFYLANLAIKNEEQFLQKVMGLCAAAEFSDEITGKHIIRVNDYSELLAKHLGMSDWFVHAISQVAALHDIGKVAIPELIKLDRKYTDEERAAMQGHTVFGAQIIDTMQSFGTTTDTKLEMARNIALHHHQSWNGQGYPGLYSDSGELLPLSRDMMQHASRTPLKGDQIPIEALITGLADSYDALRSPRPYKPEFSHEKTLGILSKDDRTGITGADRFSPKVWAAFLEVADKMAVIYDEKSSV